MAGAKNVPTGVKVISVLYYIGAALSVIAAIIMFAGGSVLATLLPAILTGLVAVMGIFMLGMAVLDFFIARGLWRAQKWARIIVIIFAGLAIIGAIVNLVAGQLSAIINLVIAGLIGGYLLFSKKVKQAFA